jgi:hypothetical protein
MSKLKGRPSPALVISLIALFVALGSGAYAAKKIGTNQIKNKAITTKKLRNKAVTTKKVKNKTVGTNKLKDESVDENKLQSDAVSTDKLQSDAVSTDKLQSEAVGESKIGPAAVTGSKIASSAVVTEKIADDAVTSAKVSSDIPYRRTLQSTFVPLAASVYQPLVTFGDAELQGRCATAGANGFMQLRVISPNNGAQADMTATDAGAIPRFANSGFLGPNTGVELPTLLLGNFNSPGVGSARVAARAPDGTALVATVGSHSLGGGSCVFNALAL